MVAAAKAYEKYKAETGLKPNKTGRVKIISDPMPEFDVFDPELRDCEHKLASALKEMDDLKAQLAAARDEINALQKKR